MPYRMPFATYLWLAKLSRFANRMRYVNLYGFAAWLCFVTLCCFESGTAISHAAPQNVVLFVADDLSPDLGCYGNPVVKTPHMDQLAAEGVRFDHAFCTTASCSASRSVILTGLHNHANGHYGHSHNYHKFSSYSWVQSLPVLLARAGYRTARVGKHHNEPEAVYHFETKIKGSARSPVEMANRCEDFIRGPAGSTDQPFFLFFATSDPHRGGGVAKDSPHQPNRFGNQPGRGAYPGVSEITYRPEEVIVPAFLPDNPVCRAELAQYYQSVSRVDQGVGRLIEILKLTGQWDRTLLIVTSDHGMAFAGAKTTVYEGGLRVPFIVHRPKLKRRGATNSSLISFVDIAPTIVDWAGGLDPASGAVKAELVHPVEPSLRGRQGRERRSPASHSFHGRSFLSILEQDRAEGWNVVYASHTFHEIQMYYPMRVVRRRKWKLIWNIAHPLPFPFASDLWASPTWQSQYRLGMHAPYGQKTVEQYIHRNEIELFDLEADPHEANNLANDKRYAEVLADLQDELKAFQTASQDPWALKWKYE